MYVNFLEDYNASAEKMHWTFWGLFCQEALFRRNPALGFAPPRRWRIEIADRLGEILEINYRKLTMELIRWAHIEELNKGSHFVVPCPISVKGSRRWHAADRGGRYRILRNLVLSVCKKMRKKEREIYDEKTYREMDIESHIHFLAQVAWYEKEKRDLLLTKYHLWLGSHPINLLLEIAKLYKSFAFKYLPQEEEREEKKEEE